MPPTAVLLRDVRNEDLATFFEQWQAVAKHLSALREAGLVESRRQGRETLYRVNAGPLDAAAAWLVRVGGEWDACLERLRALVESPRG